VHCSEFSTFFFRRDVKLENIFLTNSAIKLGDFGAVTDCSPRVDEEGAVFGTAEYFCPQRASGMRYDFRTDTFALGVVAFELVFGYTPFNPDENLDTDEILSRVRRMEFSIPQDDSIIDEFYYMIEGMMHEDPDDRLTLEEVREICQHMIPPEAAI
jgi:serine/threonine protein kinase